MGRGKWSCITCGVMMQGPGGALRCPACWLETREHDLARWEAAGLLVTVDDAAEAHRLDNDAGYRRDVAAERQARIEEALR